MHRCEHCKVHVSGRCPCTPRQPPASLCRALVGLAALPFVVIASPFICAAMVAVGLYGWLVEELSDLGDAVVDLLPQKRTEKE